MNLKLKRFGQEKMPEHAVVQKNSNRPGWRTIALFFNKRDAAEYIKLKVK